MADEIKYHQQLGRLSDYIKGYHAVHVVNTGVKLGLFASLEAAEEGLAPADLAAHPDYLQSGRIHSFQDHGPEFSAGVADLTAGLQMVVSANVLPKLPGMAARLGEPLAVLDMGCGAGGRPPAEKPG